MDVLSVEDCRFFAASSYTHAFSGSAALRVYADTRPYNLKISQLQKGLVLLYKGREVVGEGAGFGAPILKYMDETVFSGTSNLQVYESGSQVIIQKDYDMNLVLRDKLRNLTLESVALRRKIDYAAQLYQKNKKVARSVGHLKMVLSKLGVKSRFVPTTSRGEVATTYTIKGNKIGVKMVFSQINQSNLQKLIVMNEQGAHFFEKYSDSEKRVLNDEEIGVWNEVTAKAASICDCQNRLCFRLKTVKNSLIRRGREVANGSLDWIGLDYEFNPQNTFEYEIEILEKNR